MDTLQESIVWLNATLKLNPIDKNHDINRQLFRSTFMEHFPMLTEWHTRQQLDCIYNLKLQGPDGHVAIDLIIDDVREWTKCSNINHKQVKKK